MSDTSATSQGQIFISYRRDETAYAAGWLYDRLADRFGADKLFKDIDSIELGDDFVEVITAAVGACDVLLALIGEEWLTITGADGQRRLDDPADFVRVEIEAALARDVRVIPVLVDGASMPSASALPDSLSKLVRRQALELSPNRFDFDTGRLLRALEGTLAEVQAIVEATAQFPPVSTVAEEALPQPPSTPAPPAPIDDTLPPTGTPLPPPVSTTPDAEQMATESQTPVQPSQWDVSQGVRCSRGHVNEPGALYCGTCGVSLAVSADQDWFCPEGHFNPLGGGPACVVCGALMAARMLDHDVQFTVYRPRAMRPRTWERLLVFIHRTEFAEGERDPVEEVRRQAEQVLGTDASRFRSTSQDAGLALPRGDELSLVPQVDGLEFKPPQRSFRWLRDVHREEFDFITDLPDGTNAHGSLGVYLGSVLIAEVPLSIPVSAAAAGSQPGGPQDIEHARLYRRIFASYAHDDAEVVEQVLAFAAVTGDEFMRDVTHLRSGQDWNEALRDLIRQADLFQLFWSWNSMRSPEVKKEYKYALSLKRPEFIRPVYWQDPFPETQDLPPEDLRAIQFSQLPGRLRADEQPQDRSVQARLPQPPPPPASTVPPPPQQTAMKPPAPAGGGMAWSTGTVVVLALGTLFSAGIVGIVAGLIGRSTPAKRKQAYILLCLGVVWLLLIVGGL